MRRVLLPAFLLAATLSLAQEFKLGSKAGDFTVTDLKGNSLPYSALKGDTTVVIFIATKCPISNAYNGRMNAVYNEYSHKGVNFIFINSNYSEPAAEVEEHARTNTLAFPVYKDQNNVVADLFGAQVTPEAFVMDNTGTIRYHGYIDDSTNEAKVQNRGLRLALDSLLERKAVQTAQTKAFGCTIKRKKRAS